MNKKIYFVITCLLLLIVLSLSGCKSLTKIEELKKDGNTIVVRYDANGGTYLNRKGITIIDMFNPADYSKDSSGTIHISLLDPCDENRPAGTNDGISITRTDYFLVGWYKNKEVKTNKNGKVINDDGETLVEIDGAYYLESDNTVSSTPAYTYSGHWDFDNDTIDITSDMESYEMTLYACWAKSFRFDYYANTNGNWELVGTNNFDYMTTNSDAKYADKDTIWTPTWVDGAMNYNFKYTSGSSYNFPKVVGYTFKAAYLDKELTQKIETSFEHQGTINFETGEAINSVQNIYIDLEKGEYYHINEAKQLINNANLDGIYIIENDLDFEGLEWPTTFSLGIFNGKIYTKDDLTFKLSNISVTHSSENAKNGGIFGSISENASIKNVTFDNATLDISYAGRRNRNTNFGLFTGKIEDGALIENVCLSGTIKFGEISLGDNYSINLVANGNISNISLIDDIHVIVYGTLSMDQYSYTIDTENVSIDENGFVTLTFKTSKLANESYVIK